MERKIIFIDVDGTLVGFKDGGEYIPESAVAAIHQARANGHRVYLCTGRSKGELYDYIMEIGFDGVVGAAGGFVETDEKMIFHKTLSVETVEELMAFFRAHQIQYYLESNAGLFCEKASMKEFARKFFPGLPEDTGFFGAMKDVSQAPLDDVNKVTFMSTTLTYEQIAEHFGEDYSLVKVSYGPGLENSGEIAIKGINKATSIGLLLEYLHADQADTYAFGDSMNDREMMQCVATAIAMGNARDGLKEIADYVTDDLGQDGIYNAMKHFGLI